MNLRTIPLLMAVPLASLALVACGSSDSSTDTSTITADAPAATTADTTPADTTPTDTTGTVTPPPATTSTAAAPPASGKDPAIPFPATKPTTLVVKDLKTGTGAVAKSGDTVTVNYVGASFSDKKTFDSSFTRGEPFPFKLGAGMVIAGWDKGVAGMRVGGRRLLVIPPALGYGAQGTGPIGPNETLVFVVDLLKVEPS